VSRPDKYYRVNVVGGLNLLDAMVRAGVKRVLFSSTAAVYGSPERIPIDESHPTKPVNPYGWSKLMFERLLEDHRTAFGIGYVALRYFNAAGADESGEIGEAHRSESHLIPRVIAAAINGTPFSIFGDDYDTRDGTAVRDYVHISDLAQAHMAALGAVSPGETRTWNVGSGNGYSCREVLESARRITGRAIPCTMGPRRPGDPPTLVASSDQLTRDLGWKPQYTRIDDIIASAWKWHSTHPRGYED
jgi:UDP-glucose 4-epimerase